MDAKQRSLSSGGGSPLCSTSPRANAPLRLQHNFHPPPNIPAQPCPLQDVELRARAEKHTALTLGSLESCPLPVTPAAALAPTLPSPLIVYVCYKRSAAARLLEVRSCCALLRFPARAQGFRRLGNDIYVCVCVCVRDARWYRLLRCCVVAGMDSRGELKTGSCSALGCLSVCVVFLSFGKMAVI